MSLGNRLALWILCLPLAVLALAAILALHQDAQWRKSALKERLTTAAELQAPRFGEALAAADDARLERLGQQLLELDEIRHLGIHDTAGKALLSLGSRSEPFTPPSATQRQLDSEGDIWRLILPLAAPSDRSDAAPAGWMTLDIDTRRLTLAFYRHLASAGLGLLVIGLLLFVIGATLGRRLDGRLQDASEALHRLAKGSHHTALDTEQGSPELDRLARRINALGTALEASRDDMQRQIEQTTAELQESMETIEIKNIELDLAHRRALEASRVKSEFLASMSHEIRTPLNGIVGFCRLLGRSRLEPRQREWLDQVQVACDNLLALVNDVLDFSRLEAGRLELERTDIDMVTLVDEVLGLQAPLAHQKHLELLGLVYDDVPRSLRGDPLRIRQVLTNLVHNALKFTESGEVIVRVMVEAQTTDGRTTLQISVSDTGIGLTPEQQRELFQAFRQATPGHSRQYGGSGLGLAISRQLVEQMGGEIRVDSEPGQGSTFTITLPLESRGDGMPAPERLFAGERIALLEPHAPTRFALHHLLSGLGARVVETSQLGADDPPPTLAVAALPSPLTPEAQQQWQARLSACRHPVLLLVNASPLELPEITLPEHSEMLCKPLARQPLADALRRLVDHINQPAQVTQSTQLLVVDDNASNRRLLREMLARPGLIVAEAASGEEALALAESEHFDLVLMDIRMPGMDGIETTRALRRLGGSWSRCPVIAVTAHALEPDRQRLCDAGLQDVLIKPVDGRQLETLLHRHLSGWPPSEPHESDVAAGVSPASESLDVVDMALGTRLANGSESLARELLEELVRSLPESERAIRDALAGDDEEALLDAVHSLNGACRYCGAPELALIAETLETRLRSRGMAAVDGLVAALFDAMERVLEWHALENGAQPSSTTMASANSASSESDR
ncbi:ATP-binding protein [Billgrantia gudaonensis]|uniref:histidine kinase n=1 Tax=Billgrantia gudaonensis TaxID=376427 RepID=A0A1G8NFG3_9GAMM|nr:ATP-binding protein [Halomonas gudaonensis]SDI78999.1 two-component system, NarL family, sensor histidine kinase BarA [Halomonas gudaonensis]